MKNDGRLQLSEAALHDLESQAELAEMDKLCEDGQQVRSQSARLIDDDDIAAASMQPTMMRHHVFSMVRNVGSLYLKMKDALKLKDGRVQVVYNNSARTPAFYLSPPWPSRTYTRNPTSRLLSTSLTPLWPLTCYGSSSCVRTQSKTVPSAG
jgi:hypothetical protein